MDLQPVILRVPPLVLLGGAEPAEPLEREVPGVEQPIRVARLVAGWIADGDCRRSIFNLKLPMKKRYDELARCRAAMDEICRAQGVHCVIRFKHLFHDREEVTGYAFRSDATPASRKKGGRRSDQ